MMDQEVVRRRGWLMAVVTWQLARAALVDAVTAGLGLLAAVLMFWLPVNSACLVLGGAGVGLAVRLLGLEAEAQGGVRCPS